MHADVELLRHIKYVQSVYKFTYETIDEYRIAVHHIGRITRNSSEHYSDCQLLIDEHLIDASFNHDSVEISTQSVLVLVISVYFVSFI